MSDCVLPFASRHCRRRSQGIVLVVLVVVMGVALALFGIWARQIVRAQRRLESRQYRVQAQRLAEAGVRRAIARLAADANFTGESWTVPADQLDSRHAAVVRIEVAPSPFESTLRCQATAEFPAGAVRRATIIESIQLPVPAARDEP
jgi:Tfp pilus assembly protein PilX